MHSIAKDSCSAHALPRLRTKRSTRFSICSSATLRTDRSRGLIARRSIAVLLDGGELEVEVGDDLHVNLTGWARPVFEGRLSEDFEKELHETE